MLPEEEEELQRMLEKLTTEHRDLDIIIQQLTEATPIDFLRLQRLKKRKLFLKDSISKIESMMPARYYCLNQQRGETLWKKISPCANGNKTISTT